MTYESMDKHGWVEDDLFPDLAPAIPTFSPDDMRWLLGSKESEAKVNAWLARGDGVAVYENKDFSHRDIGHKQFVSFDSPAAMLEVASPPDRLPDIGGAINWRYQLIGIYWGEQL